MSSAVVTAATQFTVTVRKKGGASHVCVKGNSLVLKPMDFSQMVDRLFFACKRVTAAMATQLVPATIQMHLEKLKYLKLKDRSGSVQRVTVKKLTWVSSLCHGGGGKATVLISYQSTIYTHTRRTR